VEQGGGVTDGRRCRKGLCRKQAGEGKPKGLIPKRHEKEYRITTRLCEHVAGFRGKRAAQKADPQQPSKLSGKRGKIDPIQCKHVALETNRSIKRVGDARPKKGGRQCW